MTRSPGARFGRILMLLLAGGAAGSGLSASSPAAPATAGALESTPGHPSAVMRLQGLIEAAEKALEAEDADTAGLRADEAEALVEGWSVEVLRRPDIAPLIERLRVVRRQLDEIEAEAEGGEPAMEVVDLTPDEAATELARVREAEGGALYDFPIDLNDTVLAWVHAFTNQKKGFIEGSLSRATQYLPMVQQVFEEEGLPRDLAFLAVVESGFKNTAKSRAKAVGMWQFIKSTGRIYGLTGNAWVEERRDPIKATRAAARYLKRLYEITGDWYLALAGYNAGPLTVERAAAGLGSRNYWDMARSRFLRNETKNYVPQLCAAILIGRHPEKYGLAVVQMPPYVYETVAVERQTRLSVVARHAGVSETALKDLNPELLRGMTPPGRYLLRVPPGLGASTQRALAGLSPRERVETRTYVVRKGDTLARVAARFKVTPEDLLETNGLRRNQFRVGRRLQIPPPTPALPAATVARTEQPLEPMPEIPGTVVPAPAVESVAPPPARPAESQAPATVPAEPETRPAFHRVKPGETLYAIGTRYGIPLDHLRKWNRIKGNRIQAGQRLRLQKP